ncbi:MAG: hypothetical protein LBI53_07570 [Candidatus Peribacteria bacterium]|jgi:hypothetical protein|nr:hypothetical protein [Candidatus Peribacteria bacterium]
MKQAIENKILEDRKTPEDRDLEHMIAKQRGIDPKTEKDKCNKIKQDIKQQNELQRIIKTLTDDKGNKVYDMIIQEIFSKIIQIRKRQQIYEKSPRLFSEGGQFDAQSFTSGIISLKSGNHDPLLMKQISKKEKEQKKAGAFNITFILDGS